MPYYAPFDTAEYDTAEFDTAEFDTAEYDSDTEISDRALQPDACWGLGSCLKLLPWDACPC